jgi:hypothetical protein
MADPVATQDALAVTEQSQSQPASNSQAQGQSDGRPSSEYVAKKDLQNLQSSLGKQISSLQQQLQQRDQYIQQVTNQMRQAERNSAPDDFAKLEIDLRHEREEKQALYAQLQQLSAEQQAANARNEALQRLADRYGVEREEIERAKPSDYDEAVEVAITLRDKRKAKAQEQDDDKRNRNLPDVGGGAPRTSSGKWEEEYEAARKRGDSVAMVRLKRLRGDK